MSLMHIKPIYSFDTSWTYEFGYMNLVIFAKCITVNTINISSSSKIGEFSRGHSRYSNFPYPSDWMGWRLCMYNRSTGAARTRVAMNIVALPRRHRATAMADTSMVMVGILFLWMATAGPTSSAPYALAHVAIFGSIGLFAFAFGLVRLVKYAKAG